jgi:Lrp/AsnC family transcriptional regulator
LYRRLIEQIDIYDVSSMFAMEQIKSTTELPLVYATPRHSASNRGNLSA